MRWADLMHHNDLHERGVDDQFSFNMLMTSEVRDGAAQSPPAPGVATGALQGASSSALQLSGKQYPLRRDLSDKRVFLAAPGDSVKLMVLPSALFAGAHAWQ
jgi:hypothetical protein